MRTADSPICSGKPLTRGNAVEMDGGFGGEPPPRIRSQLAKTQVSGDRPTVTISEGGKRADDDNERVAPLLSHLGSWLWTDRSTGTVEGWTSLRLRARSARRSGGPGRRWPLPSRGTRVPRSGQHRDRDPRSLSGSISPSSCAACRIAPSRWRRCATARCRVPLTPCATHLSDAIGRRR